MTFSADKEMNSSESGSDKSQLLRQKAEAKARSLKAVNPDEFTPEEIKVLLHELQVHQIELEMQNEELRQTQEILEFSRARYIDLYDFAPVGYVTVNREGIIIQANLTAARQLGVSRQQLLKQRLNRFILSEDQDIYYQHCRRPLQKDAVSVCQLRLMRADGGSFYARLETTVFADAEASAPVSQIVICDITAAKQYEQSLKETRNYLEKLIEGAGAPIVVWDTQMRVTAFNFAFESLTGLPAKSVIGKPVELIFAGDPCTGSREKIENAQAGKNWESLEMPVRSADGSWRSLLWTSAIVCGADCSLPVATIAQGVDITERKQAAEALRLKELVEHCFAAMLAHDLKSPLIGTMRLIDLFLDGNLGTLTPEQNAFLSLVRGSTRSLLSMVENLLDLYRIEAGAYQPRLETVDIGALVRSCCLGIAPLAACRNICLDIDMMPGLEPLEADGMSMQRVLYNLLDNAQKFSPEGGSILVAVRKSSDKIIIDISDDGPGILKEELDKLFERCLRDRAELSFKTGVGLGLYLCRHLVGAHGGELTYQAREGGGSVFTVVLPARPAKAIESSPVGSRESIDIMLVEDNAITRVCVRLMLEQTGEFNVIAEAADGESACKKVCEFKPALVLLDIGLPDISGIEVCKRIKSECPETRVLMLTSYEDGSVLLASLGAGADGYCIKGISTEDLIKAVRVVHSGTTWLDPRIKVGITTNS